MNTDALRTFCLKLPSVTEDIKWGNDLCFSVGGKMFCVSSLDAPFKIAFKVPDEEFDELSSKEGFMPAPYMARAKWVLVSGPSRLGKKEWEHFIRQSYELVKLKMSKKARKELGID